MQEADKPYYRLRIVPSTLKAANEYVENLHRHHSRVAGCKFCISVERLEDEGTPDERWVQCGVAIVGRPVARSLDDGLTAEVNRLCTDGTRNACSSLYAASKRIWREMGGKRLITYILQSEPGTSLKAAGWKKVYETRDRPQGWDTPSRRRTSGSQEPKQRWEVLL